MSAQHRTTKVVREYKRIIEKTGCRLVSFQCRAHYHLVVEKGGKQKLFIASGTPGDKHAIRNFESNIKRWAREGNPNERVRSQDHATL